MDSDAQSDEEQDRVLNGHKKEKNGGISCGCGIDYAQGVHSLRRPKQLC